MRDRCVAQSGVELGEPARIDRYRHSDHAQEGHLTDPSNAFAYARDMSRCVASELMGPICAALKPLIINTLLGSDYRSRVGHA